MANKTIPQLPPISSLVTGVKLPVDDGIQTWSADVLDVFNYVFRTIFPPGIIIPYAGTTAPTGWLLANGGTIGNAASGAARANADTVNLFTLLWGSWTNAQLGILTSAGAPTTRGASAAADYAANRRMPTPNPAGLALSFAGSQVVGSVTYPRTFGEKQNDALQHHWHLYTNTAGDQITASSTAGSNVLNYVRGVTNSGEAARGGPLTADTQNGSVTPRAAFETRMANMAFTAIIKL